MKTNALIMLLFIFVFIYGCSLPMQIDDPVTCEIIPVDDIISGITYTQDTLLIIKNFLINSLKISSYDEFRLRKNQTNPKTILTFHQYYKNIEVEAGYLNFIFLLEGVRVHGRYYRIKNLNVTPEITSDDAINTFISNQPILRDSTSRYSTRLLVKNFVDPLGTGIGATGDTTSYHPPKLVYEVILYAPYPFIYSAQYVGNVDAITGKLLRIAFYPYAI